SPLRPRPSTTLFPYTTLFRSCDAWMRTLTTHKGEPMKPAAAKRYAGFLGAVLERALHVDGWLDKNPMRGVRKPQVQEAETTILRSEEHTSELQSLAYLVCRLL